MRIALLTMVLILSGTFSPTVSAEQYYKWVDDQGVTHYSAEKPKGREASKVEAHNPPSSSQDKAMERLEKQREQSRQERQAAQEKEKKEDSSEPVNQERCEKHRKNLQTLNTTSQIRRKNPETGEMETLTQEERQAMIEKTKKALERCNEQNSQDD
mgnify:CR=1 FL=1